MAVKKSERFVIVQLDAYLDRLRATYGRKPENDRRSVPTTTELADTIGIARITLWRLAQGRTKSFNLDIASAILSEMWKCGFDTKITDILRVERPPNLVPQNNNTDNPWAPPHLH